MYWVKCISSTQPVSLNLLPDPCMLPGAGYASLCSLSGPVKSYVHALLQRPALPGPLYTLHLPQQPRLSLRSPRCIYVHNKRLLCRVQLPPCLNVLAIAILPHHTLIEVSTLCWKRLGFETAGSWLTSSEQLPPRHGLTRWSYVIRQPSWFTSY